MYEPQGDGSHEPCFREEVAPPEQRGEQWLRIKAAHADGRHCDVLRSEDDYPAFRESSPAPSPRPPERVTRRPTSDRLGRHRDGRAGRRIPGLCINPRGRGPVRPSRG